ncbi:MAG: hypothetical protein U5M51_06720 [Emticicia sp.]|nr:hypothetical protein [Emticicia sp.]
MKEEVSDEHHIDYAMLEDELWTKLDYYQPNNFRKVMFLLSSEYDFSAFAS